MVCVYELWVVCISTVAVNDYASHKKETEGAGSISSFVQPQEVT